MNVHLSLGHGQLRQHHERHAISDVMIVIVAIGLAFTAFSIAMTYGTGADHPWHMIAIVVGIPSALTGSFFCLVRGWESLQ